MVNLDTLLSFSWVILVRARYPSYPSQGYPSDANSPHKETKEVWTLQPKPSQASLSSPGKVQQCSLILWLHNTTSCTCAAEQRHRVAAGSVQHASHASHAAGKLSSISLACRSHNTTNKNFEFDICHLPDHLLGHLPEHLLNPSRHPNQVTCQSTNLQPSIAYESLVLTENKLVEHSTI